MTDLNTFIAALEVLAASRGPLHSAGDVFNDRLHVSVDPVMKRGSNRRTHYRVTFLLDGKRVSRAAVDAAL